MNTNYLIQETNSAYAPSPLRANAFELSDDEKISRIKYHFAKIMDTLGLDLEDDSLKNTPGRVAKMYVKELFSGLDPDKRPRIALFENKYGYKKMLIEKDIPFFSCCEHHFVPIIGKAHVAYIPREQVIGLSKINRLVHYYARRPQVQERLTIQIAEALKEILQHNDVAVIIEAEHLCVASRGVKDTGGTTVTASYSGQFENESIKQELLAYSYNKI